MSDQINPDSAVEYIIANARKHAQAKANRRYLEEFRKSKKSLLMNECTEKAYAAKEMYAYSHPDYLQVLDGIKAAVEAEEFIHWKLRAAELRIDIFRTKEASNRMQDRGTR